MTKMQHGVLWVAGRWSPCYPWAEDKVRALTGVSRPTAAKKVSPFLHKNQKYSKNLLEIFFLRPVPKDRLNPSTACSYHLHRHFCHPWWPSRVPTASQCCQVREDFNISATIWPTAEGPTFLVSRAQVWVIGRIRCMLATLQYIAVRYILFLILCCYMTRCQNEYSVKGQKTQNLNFCFSSSILYLKVIFKIFLLNNEPFPHFEDFGNLSPKIPLFTENASDFCSLT